MKPQVAHEIVRTITKWMRIRTENDLHKIEDAQDFEIQADHSLRGGLLGRMMIA